MSYDFDLFVIGAGSGGVRAARMASLHGARVGIAEEYAFGGTCVIRGCIPKKLFVYASQFGEDFEDAVGFGWIVPEKCFDWNVLLANKNKEIARLSELYRQNVIKAGVEIFDERAEFLDLHTVQLKKNGRKITARYFLIATGGHPSHEADTIAGAEHCITSNEAFHLPKLPRRIVIAGGGYIGVEFAHIFHGLGCAVTIACRPPKLLRGFDEDMRDCLMAEMRKNGIEVLPERVIKRVDKRGDTIFVLTDKGETLETDCAMLAIGRHPNTRGLGLDEAGVARGWHECVKVDKYSATNVPHIYAIGDVTDRVQLTPVAILEAMCFVRTVFEEKPTAPDYNLVPTAVFSRPEIGTVGLTEEQALKAGHSIDVYKSTFRPLKHTLSGRDTRAQFKLVVDSASDEVLGCHIFGFDAAEIIQVVAVALKMGATKAQFDSTIALHPSAAEELVTMRTKAYSKTPGTNSTA